MIGAGVEVLPIFSRCPKPSGTGSSGRRAGHPSLCNKGRTGAKPLSKVKPICFCPEAVISKAGTLPRKRPITTPEPVSPCSRIRRSPKANIFTPSDNQVPTVGPSSLFHILDNRRPKDSGPIAGRLHRRGYNRRRFLRCRGRRRAPIPEGWPERTKPPVPLRRPPAPSAPRPFRASVLREFGRGEDPGLDLRAVPGS